jgi:hypothetical protein
MPRLVLLLFSQLVAFLAHLWWTDAITWWLSYVMRSLAGMFRNRWSYWPETLYTCTPRSMREMHFGPIWFLAWPPGGQIQKHKKCCNSWSNGWISYLVSYLTFKVAEVKVQNGTFGRHVSLLFDLEHSNLVYLGMQVPSIVTKNNYIANNLWHIIQAWISDRFLSQFCNDDS